MFCPNCGTVLEITERQGVEIDYCPSCRGIWLDRGELDKIIDRMQPERPHSDYRSTLYTPHAPEKRKRGKPRPDYRDQDNYRYDDDDDDHYERRHHRGRKDYRYGKRRKSWKKRGKDVLEDIFDIFD